MQSAKEAQTDSTGAVCGNILGAWLGYGAVDAAFTLDKLDTGDIVEKMADMMAEMR